MPSACHAEVAESPKAAAASIGGFGRKLGHGFALRGAREPAGTVAKCEYQELIV
jgi:hypothetical protein